MKCLNIRQWSIGEMRCPVVEDVGEGEGEGERERGWEREICLF